MSQAVGGDGPWWDVIAAMTRAADKPHVGFADEASVKALGGLQMGRPLTTPGIALCRASDQRLVTSEADPRGWAHASGLRRGDVVLTIDGQTPRASGLELLRFSAAAIDQVFVLDIERAGQRLRLELVARPGDVPVVEQRLLHGPIGYVRVRWFAAADDERADTAAAVRSATEDFPAETLGLIVDLRSGMGGSLQAVVGILTALTSAGTVLAFQDENDEPRLHARNGARVWPDKPVAVLINEQTQSAAEFLAIGLQELAGAALVGTPTAGALNLIRFVELGDGYRLLVPGQVGLGPRSLSEFPGHRLRPTVAVPNPTVSEVATGTDRQLEAAQRWLTNGAPATDGDGKQTQPA